MSREATLAGWTVPSSDSEQEKQDRTERMIGEAIAAHGPFANCQLRIYAKGSYANNTNVRADSDVDIAVECTEAEYSGEAGAGLKPSIVPYSGSWSPHKLRTELVAALRAKFAAAVDTTGKTAIKIKSNSARVDADVVPCFTYRYYMHGASRLGTMIFTTTGKTIINYPNQQLVNGREKNKRTAHSFKKAVRVLKRVENAMVADRAHGEIPSYFIECLSYGCPDEVFGAESW